MKLIIDIVEQPSNQLFQEWERLWLESENANFFNSPNWLKCNQKLNPYQKNYIITVRNFENLLLILPLVKEKKFWIETLVPPGGKHLDKTSLLFKQDPKLIALLAHYLERENLFLPEISRDLALAASQIKSVVIQESSANPFIPLMPDNLAYTSQSFTKVKRLIKKYGAKLRYQSSTGNQSNLELAFQIDKTSKKSKSGKGVFTSTHDKAFFISLIEYLQEQIRIELLFFDHNPIAFNIGFTYANTFLSHVSGFNHQFRKLSPRKILLYYTLKNLHEEGFKVFDFSRGINDFKKEFTPLQVTQYNLYHSKNKLIRIWWKLASFLQNNLIKIHIAYSPYLRIKKFFRQFQNDNRNFRTTRQQTA